MADEFKIIAITLPEGFASRNIGTHGSCPEGFAPLTVGTHGSCVLNPAESEVRAILEGLTSGRFWRVHIRKDSPEAARALLRTLPPGLYHRLSLHNATATDVRDFPGIGVHLNGRTPVPPAGFSGTISRSCHNLAELAEFPGDYAFISPVFDSISKPGYLAAFTPRELSDAGRRGLLDRAVALGGVTPDRIPELRAIGFRAAAMLSAAWPDDLKL